LKGFNTQDLADRPARSVPKRLLLKYLPAALEQGQKNLSLVPYQAGLTLGARCVKISVLSKLVGGL